MTPQEQQLLTSLTQRINQTQLQEKDPDAENLLGREIGANPDAIYILAQTVLVQNIALDQAKAQIAQLQQQVQQAHQPAHATSFLGRLIGDRDPEPPHPQQPPYQPVPTQYAQPQYQQAPYQSVPYQQPQYVPMQAGGQSSFLRGAMQTAAGVAAGALAFEGVESILHGFGNSGMGMGGYGMMGGGFERPVEENVVNNYYGQGEGPHSHEPADKLTGQDNNANDSGDNLAGFDDSNTNNAGTDDASGFDSGSQDVSSQEDSGAGFDDGGQDVGSQDDSGGGFGDDGGGGDLT